MSIGAVIAVVRAASAFNDFAHPESRRSPTAQPRPVVQSSAPVFAAMPLTTIWATADVFNITPTARYSWNLLLVPLVSAREALSQVGP